MTGKPVKQDKPRAKNLGAKKKPKRENRRTFLRVGEKRLPLEKAKIYTPKGREFDTSLIENMRESATPESTKYAQGGLAAMGRRGDSAIRPVAGRPSHVNPIEAGVIDKLGPAVRHSKRS